MTTFVSVSILLISPWPRTMSFKQQHHCPQKTTSDQGPSFSIPAYEDKRERFFFLYLMSKKELITKEVTQGIYNFETIYNPKVAVILD